MEMDIFWVVRAGQDPIKILEKHKGRYALVHIKDRDKTNTDINTEIGKGSIDFKAIIPKAKAAGVTHFIMEQENYINIDPFVSIKESCDYMKNTLHV
jgi:sugar phosphate isomerase/epimerase